MKIVKGRIPVKIVKGLLLGVSLLAVVPLVAAQRNNLKPSGPLTVYDSNGKTVGAVIDTTMGTESSQPGESPMIPFKVNQQIVRVGVKPDRFFGSVGAMYFESADCSGTPYFNTAEPSLFSRLYVDFDGTAYIEAFGASPTWVYVRSAKFPGWSYDFCASPYEVGDSFLVEAIAEGNLYQMYKPPFVSCAEFDQGQTDFII